MTDEIIKDDIPQSAPGSVPTPPASAPIPASVPVPAQVEEIHCEECNNSINPKFIFTDPKTDKHYCNACVKECENCNEKRPIIEMMKDPMNRYSSDYYCEDCYNEKFATCPHCSETVDVDDILQATRRNRNDRMRDGACTNCAVTCEGCDKLVDQDYAMSYDDNTYCEECHSEHYSTCDNCGNTVGNDDAIYVNDSGPYCERCRDKLYVDCYECEKTISKDDVIEIDDQLYCESCAQNFNPSHHEQYTANFSEFSYTKKDRFIDKLIKLLPISVKDFKSNHPDLARALNDLITFSKGKPLTLEIVKEYRQTLSPEEFPVGYTTWSSSLQRSISTLDNVKYPKGQLVLNILASQHMRGKLSGNPRLSDIFKNINEISKQSTHPTITDQIGWARLELDPNEEFILVDEIQCDHANATYQFKNAMDYKKINEILEKLSEPIREVGSPARDQLFLNGKIKDDGTLNSVYDQLLLNENLRENKDIQLIRSINKRKLQIKDEELDQLIIDRHLKPIIEADLKKKYPDIDFFYQRAQARFLADPQYREDPDVKALREIYKRYKKLNDASLDAMLSKGDLPERPEITDSKHDIKKIIKGLKEKYNLDDEGLNELITQYGAMVSDFPNIASQAISNFARKNNFKKIFWHTYESGKKLKHNDPPKSLYEKTPQDNFFIPSPDRPFGLEGEFFERQAKKTYQLYKLARKLYLKYI